MSRRPIGSGRIAWDAPLNPLAGLLEEHRAAGRPLLDLTVSNPTRCGLPPMDDAIRCALAAPLSFAYHPVPEGIGSAREAVAGDYARQGIAVHPEDLILTASTSESYSFLFAMLCDPGDAVLAPVPSYPLFEFLAGLASVTLGSYPLRYTGGEWRVDIAALRDAITPRTRALLVVNPNNPTGSYLSRAEAESLLGLCAEFGLALIADEVFYEYPLRVGVERACFAGMDAPVLCVSLGGLSKSAGMPQMKVGWMALGGPDAQKAEARQRLHLIADTFLSVSTPVQLALPDLLSAGAGNRAAIQQRIEANLHCLRAAVAEFPHLSGRYPEGGWTAVLRLPAIRTDQQWCEDLLLGQHTLVQPGYFYDFAEEACVAVSLLPEEEVFREGLHRIGREVETACAQDG